MLEMGDDLQTMNIEDHQVMVEQIDAFEDVPLDDDYPDQIAHIGN